jgi:hypothetical protein
MQSSSVEVPAFDALLMVRTDYNEAISDKADRIILDIEDALPTIWKRVNPVQ